MKSEDFWDKYFFFGSHPFIFNRSFAPYILHADHGLDIIRPMESLNWTDPKIEAEAERKYLEIALLLSDVAKEMLFNKFVTDEPFKVFAHEAGRLYELAGFAGQQALKIKYRTLVINHEHGTEDAGR